MAAVVGKRKREGGDGSQVRSKQAAIEQTVNGKKKSAQGKPQLKNGHIDQEGISLQTINEERQPTSNDSICVQIVTGSYDRVLHGFAATVPAELLESSPACSGESEANGSPDQDVTFTDTFLFAAHTSSIRCLALSPPSNSDKRILATGSSDERINLYSLSTAPPSAESRASRPSLLASSAIENSGNRSLGNLIHHDRAITSLQFPTKSKLFSAAEDNTMAISRVRDWTVLSSIKVPIPKPHGRPSGDTAGPGEIPTGVNGFAIHPSQKLMLSVGRGEKCMRLWNLMTGKKAGVLNFDRDLLAQVGEGKHSSGEGRRVLWDEGGEKYVVGFERGAAVFGIDSKPKTIIKPSPPTKLHQMRFFPNSTSTEVGDILAASTEDGRILFFDIPTLEEDSDSQNLPQCICVAQLGGRSAGIGGRIKDFEVLLIPTTANEQAPSCLIISGSSDGAVRLWALDIGNFAHADETISIPHPERGKAVNGTTKPSYPEARLIGTIETGNRITCLGAFIMDGNTRKDADEDGVGENLGAAESDESESEFSEFD